MSLSDNIEKIEINKEFDKSSNRTFTCPNMDLLDEWSRRLKLDDKVLDNAKIITKEYVKRTYDRPKYTSIKPVLAACLYIAANIWGDGRTQKEVQKASRVPLRYFSKWPALVFDELCKKREDLYGDIIDFWKDTGALDAMEDQGLQLDHSVVCNDRKIKM